MEICIFTSMALQLSTKKGNKSLLHYVAVNARTKATMGSVPIHMPKLVLISALVEILGIIAMIFTKTDDNNWPWLFY